MRRRIVGECRIVDSRVDPDGRSSQNLWPDPVDPRMGSVALFCQFRETSVSPSVGPRSGPDRTRGFVLSDFSDIPVSGSIGLLPAGSVTRPAIGFDRHTPNGANSGRSLTPDKTYVEDEFGFDRALPDFFRATDRALLPLPCPGRHAEPGRPGR